MLFYRILFGIVAVTAGIIAFFFLWGVSDGTVSGDNIGLWLTMLVAPAAVLFIAHRLAATDRHAAASVVLALVAIPAMVLGLFFLLLIVLAPDWK